MVYLLRLVVALKKELICCEGYMDIQGTKPQALAYALVDSPIGLLAWLYDKMAIIVDDDFKFDDETVITWSMVYLPSHSHILNDLADLMLSYT